MSKHHHSSTSYRINELVTQVYDTDEGEWSLIFGIEKQEDGTVYDDLSRRSFSTVYEWAQTTIMEEEQEQEYDDRYSRGRFDDDDY